MDKFNRLTLAMKRVEADRVGFYAKANAAPTQEQAEQYAKLGEQSSEKWLRLSRQLIALTQRQEQG